MVISMDVCFEVSKREIVFKKDVDKLFVTSMIVIELES